ncbi:hypothetical protein BDV3_002337 [Batrachochytrium dendrobatidis]
MKRHAAAVFVHDGTESDSDGIDDDNHSKRSRKDELILEIEGSDIKTHEDGIRKIKDNTTLVIPLIRQNVWRTKESLTATNNSLDCIKTPEPEASRPLFPSEQQLGFGLQVMEKVAMSTTNNASDLPMEVDQNVEPSPKLSIQEQALKEIMDEADGKKPVSESMQIHIPILAQNAVPGAANLQSDLEKYRHDIALRPDECTLDDYKRVPIDNFGEAMLRGMGWSDGKAIGKNSNGLLTPVVVKPRPHLLGLGATPAPILEHKQKKYIRPGEKRLPDPLAEPEIVKSTNVPRERKNSSHDKVGNTSSSHKDGISADTMVQINDGRYSGLKGSVVEVKEKPSGHVVKVKLTKSQEIVRVWKDQVSVVKTSSHSFRHSDQNTISWLKTHIRVRIISKSYRKGRFYNCKAVIDDVLGKEECVVRVDGTGELLDDICQRHLETYIPSTGKRVLIVAYKDPSFKGAVATLLEKQNDKNLAIVQLERDFSIETVAYDEIAEFVE